MALLAVAFSVVYITLCDVLPPPPNSIPCFKPSSPWSRNLLPLFSFWKCNITKTCNINFDADIDATLGTDREGQQNRILFRGRVGVILSFLSGIVIFILCYFFLSLALVYFFFIILGGGLYHFKRRKKICIVLLCKGLSFPSFSLSFFFASSPPSSYITLRWRDES